MTGNFDLVINNGRVIDPETMLDDILNVGITDGTIMAITKNQITGKETIDATGHVVSPGFIDTHFHALDGLSIRLCALDGVTTGMDLEMGAHNVEKWYEAKEDAWPINYGTSASQEGARMVVHDPGPDYSMPMDAPVLFAKRAEIQKSTGKNGWSLERSTLEQMNQITAHLDEGLRVGAVGVASTIGYARSGISTYEMFEAQKIAGRYGRLTAAHTRLHGNPNPPYEATLGYGEIILNGLVNRASVLNCHNNDYGWWEIEEKCQALREQGFNIWSEYYPYTAASTGIGSDYLQPGGVIQAVGLNYEDCMYDPQQDKMLDQAAYEQTAKEHPERLIVLFNPNRKRWLPYWYRMPHMVVAADSLWSGLSGDEAWNAEYSQYRGPPRTAGCRGKVLRLSRENGVPLMFTITQMAYWPAKHLGDTGLESMQMRGRLQEGMVADITIFNPETVTDHATYKAGEQGLPTTGIPYVIVNGEMVVRDSEFQLDVTPGQSIRFPVEAEGRFEPVSVESWDRQHAITGFSIESGALGQDDIGN